MSAHASKIGSCASCHGLDGNTRDSLYPKIAGQQLNYMISELKAYRANSRNTPDYGYMGLMNGFSDEEIREVAEYFAAQTPKAGSIDTSAEVLALGKNIYENGIPTKNVESCASCHGEKGEGMGRNARLASQHADYFIKQISWYKSGERRSKAMNDLVTNLSDEEVEAMGLYLESI